MLMRKSKLNLFILTFSFLLGFLGYIFNIQTTEAQWIDPNADPPNENVPAPINVGLNTQIKEGGLGVNSFLVENGVIMGALNRRGISIGDLFTRNSSTPGTVLFEIINNNSSNYTNLFAISSATSSKVGDIFLVTQTGNIGIGTSSPLATDKLTIEGNAKVNGTFSVKKLCFGPDCREAFQDTPVYNLINFFAGVDFHPNSNPPIYYFRRDGQDPFNRDNRYHGFPYLSLTSTVAKYGTSSNFETNWFDIGFNYWQPYNNYRASLFVEEGDDSAPINIYMATSGSSYARKNSGDQFAFAHFLDNNNLRRSAKEGTETDVNRCINNPGDPNNNNYIYIDGIPCKQVLAKFYYDMSVDSPKGRVVLEIRLVGLSQSTNTEFLPRMSFGSWGRPDAIQFRKNPFTFPTSTDIHYKTNDTELIVGSKIQGRFVVYPQPGTTGARSPLQNFVNAVNGGQSYNHVGWPVYFHYVIKSIGIAYLSWVTR